MTTDIGILAYRELTAADVAALAELQQAGDRTTYHFLMCLGTTVQSDELIALLGLDGEQHGAKPAEAASSANAVLAATIQRSGRTLRQAGHDIAVEITHDDPVTATAELVASHNCDEIVLAVDDGSRRAATRLSTALEQELDSARVRVVPPPGSGLILAHPAVTQTQTCRTHACKGIR